MDNFQIALVGAIIFALIAVFSWGKAEDSDGKKAQEIENQAKAEIGELKRSVGDLKKIIEETRNWHADLTKTVGYQNQTIETMNKEIEMLKVRQFTLEKKIIATHKNINLTVKSDKPIEVSVAPPPIEEKKKPLKKVK